MTGSLPSPEQRLKELGLELPPVPTPIANYVPYKFAGTLLFLSGQVPKSRDGVLLTGTVGLMLVGKRGDDLDLLANRPMG